MNDRGDTIERRPITDRAQWLEWRQHDVTASEVAALFKHPDGRATLHPYGRTRLSLWADKQGLTQAQADNAVLRRGRWGEAAVIEMLHDERPEWQVRRAAVYLRDPAIRLGATPDAVAVDPERAGVGVVQCKTIAESVFEREWTSGAPLGFQLQTLAEMMLAAASWGAIAVLVMHRYEWQPLIFDVERHEASEARMRAAVDRFWCDFDAGLMPVLDPEQDAETIRAIHPKALIKEQQPLDLSGDNEIDRLLTARAGLNGVMKDAKKRVEVIETAVKAKLGPHELALAPGWRISWKNEHREAYTVNASDPRVLRVKEMRHG
jgi:predicted phage-related endonuclease